MGTRTSWRQGAIGIGATLDILIPPSVGMVLYGIMTQTSIGKLLIAGVVPGIIVGLFLILAILVWVKVSPSHAPDTYEVSASERWASLRRIWSSLLLIVLVVVLLYAGWPPRPRLALSVPSYQRQSASPCGVSPGPVPSLPSSKPSRPRP